MFAARASQNVNIEIVGTAKTQNAADSTMLIVDKPTGVRAGDLLINVKVFVASPQSWNSPGWTTIAAYNGNNTNADIVYRIASAGEASTYTFSAAASVNLKSGGIIAIRGGDFGNVGSFTATAAATGISITYANSSLFAVYFSQTDQGTLSSPPAMSATLVDNSTTGSNFLVARLPVQKAALSDTHTASVSVGEGAVASIQFTVKPA